jgi:hypothetical protein
MTREIVEERVAVQIAICRTADGREWYCVDVKAPYDAQLDARGAYGEFVSRIVQVCETCIPLM